MNQLFFDRLDKVISKAGGEDASSEEIIRHISQDAHLHLQTRDIWKISRQSEKREVDINNLESSFPKPPTISEEEFVCLLAFAILKLRLNKIDNMSQVVNFLDKVGERHLKHMTMLQLGFHSLVMEALREKQ